MKKSHSYALMLCVTLLLLTSIKPASRAAIAHTNKSDALQGPQSDPEHRDQLNVYDAHLPLVWRGREPHVFLRMWGNTIGTFHDPSGIAIGQERIFVSETSTSSIQVFNRYGTPIDRWGECGRGDGQFRAPTSLSTDEYANLYVIDAGNHRIQKLGPNGEFLAKWGSEGSGEGQFRDPQDIALTRTGHIYVVDPGTARVQKFTTDGKFLLQWSNQLRWPVGITTDRQDYVYVADNGSILKFTSDGTFLQSWPIEAGYSVSIDGIDVDKNGRLHVSVHDPPTGPHPYCSHRRVQVYSAEGNLLSEWNLQDGCLELGPYRIALDGYGNLYSVESPDNLVRAYNSDGTIRSSLGQSNVEQERFDAPYGIAVDTRRSVYVSQHENFHLQLQSYTAEGTFRRQYGQWSYDGNMSGYSFGIAVDRSGTVYADNWITKFMHVFSSEGTQLRQWEGGFSSDISVDDNNEIYMTDTDNHRVVVLDSEGTLLRQWGSEGSGAGQFGRPYGIAAGRNGLVYVTEQWNHRVQVFTADGTYVRQWGSKGNRAGEFEWPCGIAVSEDGTTYVADTNNHRIQVFSSEGFFLYQLGSQGSRHGQFYFPFDIALDESGAIYVTDQGNYRVQIFAPTHPQPDPVHGLALNGSFEQTPDLAQWAYGGTLPVTIVSTATQGSQAARLGKPVSPELQSYGKAWLRQTMYVRPEWDRPRLSWHYRMFVNDIVDYSDFYVRLTRPNGALLDDILRDGYPGPNPPPQGHDMGWRVASYDLTAYKGQHVRLIFENRNLHDNLSLGIWTLVDDVRVVDAGP